jgi:hypothetical protein
VELPLLSTAAENSSSPVEPDLDIESVDKREEQYDATETQPSR